ncbi:transcriptional regulator [Lunatimonas salinarum]|uniref:transcriptional regulator n=1 Tax=Lunatimonas salinarum TaxID=1774590 RepID=UPI001ADF1C16|nr:transcriptional regulator [Lunatimonas salinarum]
MSPLLRTLPALGLWAHWLIIASAIAQQPSSTYFLQEIKRDIPLPAEAGKEIIGLFNLHGLPIVVTSQGIFQLVGGHWHTLVVTSKVLTGTVDRKGEIWIATETELTSGTGKKIALPKRREGEEIRCLAAGAENQLHLGTNLGIYSWDGGWRQETFPRTLQVNAIAVDNKDRLWVATMDGLWLQDRKKWIDLDTHMMAVGHERRYYALLSDQDGTDMYFSSEWAVGRISDDGNHWVARGNDGLPFGPATVIHQGGDGLWLGTLRGAVQKGETWRYYAGKRWLPTDQVTAILSLENGKTWIGTSDGLSEISNLPMTLERKADSIERVIEARHNRLGLVNRSKLRTPGDLSTSYMDNEDNDGLWTACYLIAQCYRYAVTKSPEAKEKATRTFEVLERLETVSGISGYPARSYARAEDTVTPSRSPHQKIWHPSPDGKWQWLDDTSSDEITGHVYSVSLYHDLVADDLGKNRAANLIDRIVTHILDNDYHLIDFDGLPTRWGIWHPDSLNHSPNWMFERGLNSLQILSFLKTAHRLTQTPRYEQVYQTLVDSHGYLENARFAKVTAPFDISHSDDILNFFPYYNLLRYLPEDHLDYPVYKASLVRTWQAVRSDRMPVWNVFASALLKMDADIQPALEEIQSFPIDLISWRMENSHRWDLRKDYLAHRTLRDQADRAIPSQEGNISRWNTNPKLMDSGDGGLTEDSGTYFLVAYWMGRYFGYWE